MNKIKSYQCAVFCSVSCHVIELPIAPHFINRKMIIATFYLLLSALKVGFRWILGRFKVGYYRKRRSPLGRFFWIFCELTLVCTLFKCTSVVHFLQLIFPNLLNLFLKIVLQIIVVRRLQISKKLQNSMNYLDDVISHTKFVRLLWTKMRSLPMNRTCFDPAGTAFTEIFGTDIVKWSSLRASLAPHVFLNSSRIGVFSGKKLES